MADVAPGHTQAVGVCGRWWWLIIPMQKTGSTGTRDFFGLALVQPLTIETEIPLADKQQSVAMGTMKTGRPNDR